MISTVIAELPELGQLNRAEVAKLVGVAPINRDSGKKSGKRFIGGGRGQVRRVLYMSTIVAIRRPLFSPTLFVPKCTFCFGDVKRALALQFMAAGETTAIDNVFVVGPLSPAQFSVFI
jgi:transposase